MKQKNSLPLLVVVAVAALVLGSVGSAAAGPALTKSKVKKIAAQVIAAQASGLSVANATHATTATKATNATNAEALDGRPASAYQDRVAQGAVTGSVNGLTAIIPATTIVVPVGATFLEISVSGTFYGGNSQMGMWWQLDNANCAAFAGPGFANKVEGHTTNLPANLAYTMIAPVSPGSHTVTTCATNVVAMPASVVTVLRTAQLG